MAVKLKNVDTIITSSGTVVDLNNIQASGGSAGLEGSGISYSVNADGDEVYEAGNSSEAIALNIDNPQDGEGLIYDAASQTWKNASISKYSVEVFLVAGGGSGGSAPVNQTGAGGGGAGGYTSHTLSIYPAMEYPIVIGAGGASTSSDTDGENGSDTTAFDFTALGGGFGARNDGGKGHYGGDGGSGGGGAASSNNGPNTGHGGSGTSPQGYDGGRGPWTSENISGAGGGGGAGSAGGDGGNTTTATSNNGGSGGSGVVGIDGNTYAGGGGGGTYIGLSGSGTDGGGSGSSQNGTAASGQANTGSGGGGGGTTSGAGGSGIVIIKYVGEPTATGGTVTQSGGYTYHTFTSSSNFIG